MMQHKVNNQPLPEYNFQTKRRKQKNLNNRGSFLQTLPHFFREEQDLSYDPSIIHTSINKLFDFTLFKNLDFYLRSKGWRQFEKLETFNLFQLIIYSKKSKYISFLFPILLKFEDELILEQVAWLSFRPNEKWCKYNRIIHW